MPTFLRLLLTSLLSLVLLFLLSKLMGNRQMSQLSMFDYITSITLGSIAAEMATYAFDDCWQPLLALLVYGLSAWTISLCTGKSLALRKFFTGKSVLLYENGILYYDNLKKSRLDLSELLCACRTHGYFDLSKIQSIFLETNGRLSILPCSDYRSVTPSDLGLSLSVEKPLPHVILDGKVLLSTLASLGLDEKWLLRQLALQGFSSPSDILLATCTLDDHRLCIYPRVTRPEKKDLFE